ncbi:MAG: hypothetical protein IJ298_07350, partial [Ruminococcus sp.]|nr:hypothetical protein [Ruminococcus sp.]
SAFSLPPYFAFGKIHLFCEDGNPFVCFADISPNRGISSSEGGTDFFYSHSHTQIKVWLLLADKL